MYIHQNSSQLSGLMTCQKASLDVIDCHSLPDEVTENVVHDRGRFRSADAASISPPLPSLFAPLRDVAVPQARFSEPPLR
jgi:hypothetical protein